MNCAKKIAIILFAENQQCILINDTVKCGRKENNFFPNNKSEN
jgi:hypothetical protein